MKEKTEERILRSAKDIFTLKGMNGARMQEIADKAKINKALLHYYFRSKEKLFEAVFISLFSSFFPEIKFIYSNEFSFYQKIEVFCDKYITLLQRNPYLPNFILTEFYRNPERLTALLKRSGFLPEQLLEYITKEMKKNNISNCTPINLLVNIISMCIFPIASKPIIGKVLFHDDKKAFTNFLEKRKKDVPYFIIQSLKGTGM